MQRLLFTSNNGAIYTINADGTDYVKIGQGRSPVWSPRGDEIAFFSSPEEGSKVFFVKPDGSSRIQLYRGDVLYMMWSPNGKQVAFVVAEDGLYVVDDDGSENHQPKQLNKGYAIGRDISWSPDSRSLAYTFQYNEYSATGIIVQDVENGIVEYLSLGDKAKQWCDPHCLSDFAPSWSPNGKRIAFISNRRGRFEMYIVEVDNKKLRQATSMSVELIKPIWSLDGQEITFIAGENEKGKAYIINADGSNPRVYISPTSTHNLNNICQVLSPDGKKIAFSSMVDGHSQIYVADADGSHPTRLTSDSNDYDCPQWQPQP